MTNSIPYPRRRFLKAIAGAALLLPPAMALSVERYQREHARIKGVGLTTFSLRRHMRYWHGEPANGDMDILDFLEYCAKTGIETAELTSYFFKTPVEREYLHEIRRRAHLLGIDLAAGAIGNNFAHPPGSDEAQQQLEHAFTWINHFAEIGIPVIRVFAGRPPSGTSVDEAIENVVTNMEEALDYAGSRGVMLGIENHDFTTNVDNLLRIVEKIDSKWFGITFDSANLARPADPYADLARIAPYTISAQIKVMIPVDGEDQPADFDRIIAILKEAGYGGYLILEYEEAEDPLIAVPRYMKEIEEALARAG
ncbi:MAG: sugar phosphate isomerase/epimerase family protein [Opitutales bacterium]